MTTAVLNSNRKDEKHTDKILIMIEFIAYYFN